jgi:peroxiredoxin
MDATKLANVKLADGTGARHRLGDYWQEQPVVLVFLRHFGCLHCREHAALLGQRYQDFTAAGVQVVAIGTGDERYAAAFVRDENIPYPVLVDDHAEAADAASVETVSWGKLLHPNTWRATVATWRNGHKIHKAGKRVKQLGATFVIAPGDHVVYEHLDSDSTDHALADEVLAALPA